jgi:hypothetical protein
MKFGTGVLYRKLFGERERPKRKRDLVVMDVKETGREDSAWIDLA